MSTQPEPWLRGTYAELPAVLRAILHAFDLAREDAVHWADDLAEAELHSSPSGLTPVSFHMRHIVRSLDRLLTYAEGNQLSPEQLIAYKTELDPAVSREEILAEFHQGLDRGLQAGRPDGEPVAASRRLLARLRVHRAPGEPAGRTFRHRPRQSRARTR